MAASATAPARARKDAVVCLPAPPVSRRFYDIHRFTPEQVRQDESRAWKITRIFYGGKRRKVRYKERALVRWQGGAGKIALRSIVVAPTPYRKRNHRPEELGQAVAANPLRPLAD